MAIDERHYVEELQNVVKNYPLWPGDVISHPTAKGCADRGWIVRNSKGDWIPTAAGVERARAGEETDG